jgi:hypothetical protein
MALLSSYRWRRRLVWAAPLLVVVIGAVALIVLLPRGSGIPPEQPRSNQPAQVARELKGVPVTPEMRREVNRTLTAFVRSAVTRQDPAAAWNLVTPAMKSGSTRAEWRRGNLPVFPFPAVVKEATGWYVIESFENDLLIELVVHARPETKRGAIAFQIDLKRIGRGADRRWLVDSFVPERVYAPSEPTAAPSERKVQPPVANLKPEYPSGRLNPLWFAVPGAILGLIILVPLVVLLIHWRRGARAEKAYRRSLAHDPE